MNETRASIFERLKATEPRDRDLAWTEFLSRYIFDRMADAIRGGSGSTPTKTSKNSGKATA